MRFFFRHLSTHFQRHLGRGLAVIALAGILVLAGCGSRESVETRRIISQLHSGSVAARLRAISAAEAHPVPRVRSELLSVFEDGKEEPLVRGAAALALGRLHDSRLPARAVKRLPEAIIGSAKPGSLQTEAFILGKALTAYGPESLDTLSSLLQYPRKEVVAWTIAHCGLYRRNDQALRLLSQYQNSKEVLYRRSAAYGLAQLFHPEAEPLLLKSLTDPDAEVRYHAAWGLSNYGSGKALAVLQRQFTRETAPQVKAELSRAVAEIRSRQGPVASQRPGSGRNG